MGSKTPGPNACPSLSALSCLRLKEGLRTAMAVSRAGNLFFQEGQAWLRIKESREEAGTTIAACVGLVAILAALLRPFMPSFSAEARERER